MYLLFFFFFRRSYRSNKNRRKQERKLLSLKEGSKFEDLGLIHVLYQIITTVYKNKGVFVDIYDK